MTKTIQELIAEVKRELATRRRVYPNWVPTKLDQATADHRIACMVDTLEILENLVSTPPAQPDLWTTQPKPFPTNPLAKSVADLSTPKQIVMIRAICRDLDINVDLELMETMKLDCKVEELSRRAASSFIDHLKQLQESGEIPIVRRAS